MGRKKGHYCNREQKLIQNILRWWGSASPVGWLWTWLIYHLVGYDESDGSGWWKAVGLYARGYRGAMAEIRSGLVYTVDSTQAK